MKTKAFKTNPQHEKFNKAMKEVLDRFKLEMSALDMLAVAAHLTGVIAAFQDQRSVTPAMALEIIAKNVEAGNAEAIAGLDATKGRA